MKDTKKYFPVPEIPPRFGPSTRKSQPKKIVQRNFIEEPVFEKKSDR